MWNQRQLKFGVFDAVANFNIGRKASILIYEKMNIVPGLFTLEGCCRLNEKRLRLANYKGREETKKRRKILRGLKKRRADKDKEIEGVQYNAGAFC